MKDVCRIVFVLSALLSINFNSNLIAQEKPIQLALFNPVQIFSENTSIEGLRLSLLYGKNASVTGLDIGLVNMSTSGQKGVQLGIVGKVNGGFVGWQSNFVSITNGAFEGLQWGGVNYHDGHFKGLQIAIVNYSATMNGLQLGLINIIKSGGFMPWFPIFNFSFE